MVDTSQVEAIINGGCLCLPAYIESKYPGDEIPWGKYKEPITVKQFKNLQNGHEGICIVTGKRSGNVEVLDFDKKIDLQSFNQVLKQFKEQVEAEKPGLLDKLVIEETQSGGRHIFYRCNEVEIPGNLKLARLDKETTLIETRGEGGLIVCEPTPGYKVTQGDLANISVISAEEREILLKYAKAFNQYVEPGNVVNGKKALSNGDLKPGEDFSEHGDILPVLEKHGWTHVLTHGSYERLRRPGKDRGWSASLIDGKVFYPFSTSTPFESEKSHSLFAVYAILEHDGDYQAAAKDLAAQGYGSNDPSKEEQTETSILPAPPKFPLHTLPKYFSEVIEQAAEAFAVPIEVPAATLLSLVGASTGQSRAVVVKSGWVEKPNLYLALVARSGLGKSPCMKAFLNGIFRIEKQRFDQYQEELKQYQQEMEARKGQKKEELGPPPEKPTWTQIYVEDTTEEALTGALSGNKKGILWYHDELSGLLMNLSRYRSDGKDGGAKARLMSAYDSGPWKRTRKSGDNEYISSACLSILGTLQPAILPELFGDFDAAIGFMPRFIFVRAEPQGPALWTDETFSGEIRNRIDYLVESLIDFDLDEEGNPKYIGMTKEAKDLYISWFNEQSLEPWKEFDSQQFEALSAKLRGQCIRIALILHILEAHSKNTSELDPIQAETMQKAIELSNWIKAHQRQVWTTIGRAGEVTECSPLEKRVANAIVSLEDEIQGGQIPTARVTEKINEGSSEKFKVDSRSVGQAVGKLGLRVRKGAKGKRFIYISEDQMNMLKENATHATHATKSHTTGDLQGGEVYNNATHATQGNDTEKRSGGEGGEGYNNATCDNDRNMGIGDEGGEGGVPSEKLNEEVF